MTHASQQRYAAEGSEARQHTIKATDEWIAELQNLPFKSCKYIVQSLIYVFIISEKNGKTLHLLKQSAKTITSSKKRKIVPLLGSIKDFHAASQNANAMSQNNMNQPSVAQMEVMAKENNKEEDDF